MHSKTSVGRKRDVIQQRNQNVLDEESDSSEYSYINGENMNYSDESDGGSIDFKVRNRVSIRSLLKESQKYEVGVDHEYTKSDAIVSKQSGFLRTHNTRASNRVKRTYEDEDEPMMKKKQRCSSKNAVMARLNRERKKRYIADLEKMVQNLKNENTVLTQKSQAQNKVIKKFRQENVYLRSLLANSKEICNILSSVTKNTGLPITSSLLNTKTIDKNDISGVQDNTMKKEQTNGNIGLNVNETARTMTVTSGPNFPIAINNVALGYSSETDANYFSDFDLEKDSLNDSLFNLENENFDTLLGDSLNLDLKSCVYPDLPLLDEEINSDCFLDTKLENNLMSDVGICLHISKKKVSLELCSICNNRANDMSENFV